MVSAIKMAYNRSRRELSARRRIHEKSRPSLYAEIPFFQPLCGHVTCRAHPVNTMLWLSAARNSVKTRTCRHLNTAMTRRTSGSQRHCGRLNGHRRPTYKQAVVDRWLLMQASFKHGSVALVVLLRAHRQAPIYDVSTRALWLLFDIVSQWFMLRQTTPLNDVKEPALL